MLFRDFKNIVELLKASVKEQEKCRDIIQPQVFEEHNQLITALLKQLYSEYAVDYILNEWLCGNKSPILFTDNDGNTTQIPMNTVNELWRAMGAYGYRELNKK